MKTIIFDFDGTIADSMKIVPILANEILESLGRPPLKDDDIQKIRKMTIAQGFAYMKIPIYRLPKIVIDARRLMLELIDDVPPVEGIIPALKELKTQGYQLAIVTSNSEENVEAFLQRVKLTDVFSFVTAGAGPFSKARLLRQTLKKNELEIEDCVYVGDEIRDVQSAQAIKMPVIAVGWGVNHPERLAEEKPDAIIAKPSELMKTAEAML